ncbi:hypothetical protein, partial [Escherichia coli]
DRNRSHWSTSKTPSYTKSVSWQHHPPYLPVVIDTVIATLTLLVQLPWVQFLRSCYDPRLY